MKLRVLGCSGGIGSALHTTSFLLDDDILLDAGTGVGELSLEELRRIRHIFLTHAHLDHVAGLPLLVDTLFGVSEQALIVHALPETIDVLRRHVFNWQLWPDFSQLPDPKHPRLRFEPMHVGESRAMDERTVAMLPARHTVPAAGYCISGAAGTVVFTGDTSPNELLWPLLNDLPDLKLLMIECAFADRDRELAELARHYCPATLSGDLAKLQHRPKIAISHLKPGYEDRIMRECRQAMPGRELIRLQGGEVFSL